MEREKTSPSGTRISVALLVPQIVFGTSLNNAREVLNFGLVHKAKGVTRIQALGGAALLTRTGFNALVMILGAHDFSRDNEQSPWDARFYVDESNVERVLALFDELDPELFDIDPLRDAGEELLEAGIVSEAELKTLRTEYTGSYLQPAPHDGTGSSKRGAARRLFHLFRLYVGDEALYQKVVSSNMIRVLSREELESTDGGRQKGLTSDGIEIADNLFV